VDLDSILSQAFVIERVTVFGEVNMLKGSNDKANVLWKDRSVTGEARSLSCRVGRIEDLCTLVIHTQQTRGATHVIGQHAGANDLHLHGLFLV
jgi:hypothetical protein